MEQCRHFDICGELPRKIAEISDETIKHGASLKSLHKRIEIASEDRRETNITIQELHDSLITHMTMEETYIKVREKRAKTNMIIIGIAFTIVSGITTFMVTGITKNTTSIAKLITQITNTEKNLDRVSNGVDELVRYMRSR